MTQESDLPPELAHLAVFLGAQPSNVQSIFQYCLCLAMVEAGKMKIIETVPSETGPLCTFETIAGDVFTIPKPVISEEDEIVLIEQLRVILDEEWG